MAITINGAGTITGVSVGGLPDGIVDADTLATDAVTTVKLATDAVTTVKIEDDAVTDAKQSLSGAAKAWVNFNGTGTVAIRDSFNVASITDNGTGNYTANFTNNMSNANYAASCGAMNGTSIGTSSAEYNVTWSATSSSIQVGTWAQIGGSFADRDFVHILVFGD